MRMVVVYVVGW